MTVSDFRSLKADVIRRNILSEDYFAESITLVDSSGVETAIVAKPNPERTEQRDGEFGTEIVVTRDIFIDLSDATPYQRGFAVVGSTTYAIEEITKTASGFAVLKTKRVDSAERSRQNYRRQT